MPGPTPPTSSVLTIGSFDGVHAGHRALINRARDLATAAEASGRTGPRPAVVALVFDPSPMSVLRPESSPPRLSTFEQRRAWLLEAGADQVVALAPTPSLLVLSPDEFIKQQVEAYRPVAWVEGPDFRFGRGREGDVDRLRRLGNEHGFETSVVEPVSVVLDDHSIVPARSTLARWLLFNGRVRDAAHILNRPYQMIGEVVQGDRRGREIGYPTANLASACMTPADGVYAGRAVLPDGRRVPAAISVGTKPTFSRGSESTVEAFLLEQSSGQRSWSPLDGLTEYGWTLRLDFVAFIRDQVAFDQLAALLDQIERDCERVMEIMDSAGASDRTVMEVAT